MGDHVVLQNAAHKVKISFWQAASRAWGKWWSRAARGLVIRNSRWLRKWACARCGYAAAARGDSRTGDELVSIEQAPGPFQIRNSNSISLAAQVAMAGGEPVMLGVCRTNWEAARLIGQGIEADMLVLTGGVS